jgi:transcriptional regulator with GAF, ATPase, and Fis domain
MQVEMPTSDISASSSVAASLLVPDLDSENPYDMPRALDRALTSFVRLVSVQGGWLAIRRGDSLDVHAQWNAPACANLVLGIDGNTILRRLSRNLTPMVVNRGDPLWVEIPHKGLKSNTKLWVCVPLIIGQRLIGVLALWRTAAFKSDEWSRLTDLATQVAPAVETIITFAELAGHLRRLATLGVYAHGFFRVAVLINLAAYVCPAFTSVWHRIDVYILSSDNRLLNGIAQVMAI